MPAQIEADNETLLLSHMIPAGRGFAFSVRKGQIIHITDLDGQQVADLLCFDATNTSHRFSRAQTKKLNARIWISVGHILYSNLCRPMFRIIRDTVGKHDMQFSPCGPEDNLVRFGERGKRTCIGNFMESLRPYSITRDAMNEPFGIFFNMVIDASGCCSTHPPLSKPGDFIEFQACMDLVVGLSACPQIFNRCNGHKLGAVGVKIFQARTTSWD